jgi:hypothetical protein
MPNRKVFRRAASALTRLFRGAPAAGAQVHARPAHRQTDIPLDQIEHAYTPTQTSLKGPFRTSGAERQRDQEFGDGTGDGRWHDEDRFTNKSGDPRIGTHGRTYEPGEDKPR